MQVYNVGVARKLRDCLTECPPIMLEAIAEGWRIALTDEQVPDIVDRLIAEMTEEEAVKAVLQCLTDVEREALAFVAAKGQEKAHILARKYGYIRRLGPGRLEWEQAWQNPASAVERLWFLGLIHRGYGVHGRYHGEVFFVPQEILAVLPAMSAPLPVFRVESSSRPRVVRDDQHALAHDAFIMLSYLRNHDVRARKGMLAGHELANIRHRLVTEDPRRLQFLHHICEQTGLISRVEGLWQPTRQAATWLKKGALARCRALYRAWLEDASWNELHMMPSVRCEDTGWRNDPALARRGVLDFLRQCAPNVWLSVASFVEAIHAVDSDFMRPDGDYDSWFIRDAQTGLYLMGYGNWEKVEGMLIRHLLEHPLRWLGVTAIGYARREEAACSFMLTEQGASILGVRGVPVSKEHSASDRENGFLRRLVVQPSFEVTVPPEVSWYDRFLLERFARWMDEQHGIARYAIDAGSVRAALEKGVTIRQICAFLRRATGNRVPQGVLNALKSRGGDKLPR
jgi:hypothetical protein